jgi:hypothetical protein
MTIFKRWALRIRMKKLRIAHTQDIYRRVVELPKLREGAAALSQRLPLPYGSVTGLETRPSVCVLSWAQFASGFERETPTSAVVLRQGKRGIKPQRNPIPSLAQNLRGRNRSSRSIASYSENPEFNSCPINHPIQVLRYS